MSLSLPASLTPREILFNKVWLQAMVITGIFYGIVVTLGGSCLHLLSVSRETSQGEPRSSQRQNKWLRIYVVFLLIFTTVDMALKGIEVENAYLNHSDYPGGPATFMVEDISGITVARAICFVLLQWASDGLLLWRCLSFFSALSFFVPWTQIILSLLWFINAALSIIFIIASASPQYFGQSSVPLRLSYGFYTLFLNTFITLAIVIKLLFHRRAMIRLLGPGHGRFYLGVISILIESAAVIFAYDLFYLIPAMLRFPLFRVGRQIGVMVQTIPPLMIIQRVAQGIDSAQEVETSEITMNSLSDIEFARKSPESISAEIVLRSVTPVGRNSGERFGVLFVEQAQARQIVRFEF